MTNKKNIVEDSFNDLNASGDIKISIGDRGVSLRMKVILASFITITSVAIVIIAFQQKGEIKLNINETHGTESPIVIDSGGGVKINFQNIDPFTEDSEKYSNPSR